MQFSKTKLSVLNPVNSLQSKNVHRQRSHTLAVEYATDVNIAHSDVNTDALFTLSKQHGYQ